MLSVTNKPIMLNVVTPIFNLSLITEGTIEKVFKIFNATEVNLE
jgi:hypothetical protein